MAKQSGIHQIKGKVGQMSYYRTKGVADGVIRSINQGMSARVKTEEAYANTRLNNAEFGNANKIATAAFNSVNSRKRGMMRNFAIAAMTKAALEDIKQGTGAWGARVPATELDTLICSILENHAKGGPNASMFGTITVVPLANTGAGDVTIGWDEATATALAELGIDGMYIVPSKCLAGEVIVDDLPRLYSGNSIGLPEQTDVEAGVENDVTITYNLSTPASVGMSPSGYTAAVGDEKHGFYLCLTFLPYRTIGAQRHTLQEYCTYVAIPLGQIPE